MAKAKRLSQCRDEKMTEYKKTWLLWLKNLTSSACSSYFYLPVVHKFLIMPMIVEFVFETIDRCWRLIIRHCVYLQISILSPIVLFRCQRLSQCYVVGLDPSCWCCRELIRWNVASDSVESCWCCCNVAGSWWDGTYECKWHKRRT